MPAYWLHGDFSACRTIYVREYKKIEKEMKIEIMLESACLWHSLHQFARYWATFISDSEATRISCNSFGFHSVMNMINNDTIENRETKLSFGEGLQDLFYI